MDQQSDQAWASILSQSDKMLELANNGEFENLVDLEVSRLSKIKEVFQQHEDYAANDYVKNGISKILKIDAEIQEKCRVEQAGLLKQIKSLNTGKNATSAYLDNSK
ncbi:MAG: flagellar protein FliT [Thiohalomonadales bacterium]